MGIKIAVYPLPLCDAIKESPLRWVAMETGRAREQLAVVDCDGGAAERAADGPCCCCCVSDRWWAAPHLSGSLLNVQVAGKGNIRVEWGCRFSFVLGVITALGLLGCCEVLLVIRMK